MKPRKNSLFDYIAKIGELILGILNFLSNKKQQKLEKEKEILEDKLKTEEHNKKVSKELKENLDTIKEIENKTKEPSSIKINKKSRTIKG